MSVNFSIVPPSPAASPVLVPPFPERTVRAPVGCRTFTPEMSPPSPPFEPLPVRINDTPPAMVRFVMLPPSLPSCSENVAVAFVPPSDTVRPTAAVPVTTPSALLPVNFVSSGSPMLTFAMFPPATTS